MILRRAVATSQFTGGPNRRPVRSFVLRQGRMSLAQQRALDVLFPAFGIPFDPQPLDVARLFGRSAPTILEIGFGMAGVSHASARTAT